MRSLFLSELRSLVRVLAVTLASLAQADWEREVAAQEAAIRSDLTRGAPGGAVCGVAAQLTYGLPSSSSASPGASDMFAEFALPASGDEPDSVPMPSLLSKVAQALQQAGGHSPGASARAARQLGASPAEAAGSGLVEPQVAHARAAVTRKMEAASQWLDRLTVDDPQCLNVLTVLQTCALTLSLLSGGIQPHAASAAASRLRQRRPAP